MLITQCSESSGFSYCLNLGVHFHVFQPTPVCLGAKVCVLYVEPPILINLLFKLLALKSVVLVIAPESKNFTIVKVDGVQKSLCIVTSHLPTRPQDGFLISRNRLRLLFLRTKAFGMQALHLSIQ